MRHQNDHILQFNIHPKVESYLSGKLFCISLFHTVQINVSVKVANAVKARDYWIFLVAQHEMSRLEMDGQGLLGI